MIDKNFTLLTKKQVFDNQIDLVKKRGASAAITDFSILLGGYVNNHYRIINDDSLRGRTGDYWLKTKLNDSSVYSVRSDGGSNEGKVTWRDFGVRPVLTFSSSSTIPRNTLSEVPKETEDGILEVEYGYYPQTAVDKKSQKLLEHAYKKGNIKETGNKYTLDSRTFASYDLPFFKRELVEFEFDGHRYVRIQVNSYLDEDSFTLSNDKKYHNGDIVWIEVSPIKWLVDKNEKIMVSDKILFAGIQFKHTSDYDGNFEETDIKKFMDNYFSKEINTEMEYTIANKDNKQVKKIKKEIYETFKELISFIKNNYEQTETLEQDSAAVKVYTINQKKC